MLSGDELWSPLWTLNHTFNFCLTTCRPHYLLDLHGTMALDINCEMKNCREHRSNSSKTLCISVILSTVFNLTFSFLHAHIQPSPTNVQLIICIPLLLSVPAVQKRYNEASCCMNHWYCALKVDRGAWLHFCQEGARKCSEQPQGLSALKKKGKIWIAGEGGRGI